MLKTMIKTLIFSFLFVYVTNVLNFNPRQCQFALYLLGLLSLTIYAFKEDNTKEV